MNAKTTLKTILSTQVYKYFLKGLNAKEIGKLLDVSARTIQRIVKDNNFKEESKPKTIQQKAFEFSKQGFSYTEIAKKLKCSKTTVYTHIKKVKQNETV